MWHKFPPALSGAGKAAPLLIENVVLRNYYADYPCTEKLTAKLDTAASMSVIPIEKAVQIGLVPVGTPRTMRPFDHSIDSRDYPTFYAEIFVPQWGWKKHLFLGCQRDSILLGLDWLNENLLMVNWRCGFGMKPARRWHRPLELFFTRVRKKKM